MEKLGMLENAKKINVKIFFTKIIGKATGGTLNATYLK
jgi:hypothetical protein